MAYDIFAEFVKDKDEYARARFMALAKQMNLEGRRQIPVLMSMIRAGGELASQCRPDDLLEYYTWLSEYAETARKEIQAILDRASLRAEAILAAEDAAANKIKSSDDSEDSV